MNHAGKPIIGIAGGIGSGKSTVARILADLGCTVADSDAAARAALHDPAVRQQIIQQWGEHILDDAGDIDRSKLANIVFSDPPQRRILESITHPWIEARREEQFASAPHHAPALVIDAPLLFEAGLDQQCDAIIFVDAPWETRLQRVQSTRGWDEAELKRREDSQLSLDEKRQRADDIIVNNGDVGELVQQVRRTLNRIVESRRI